MSEREIQNIVKRAVNVFINTGSIPDYVARDVARKLIEAGYVKADAK